MITGQTVLASAARTATVTSGNYKARGARGIIAILDVTAASGTGGLQVGLQAYDPTSDKSVVLHTLPTAVTATGTKAYVFYPGAASVGTNAYSTALPEVFNLKVTAGDSSSNTYSLSFSVLA